MKSSLSCLARLCGPFQGWAGRLAPLIGAFICFTAGARAQTVINGDFSSGNTGFSSGYIYTTAPAPTFTAGNYTIGTNPSSSNGGWVTMGDHTTGIGNMMIVNGATDGTSPVWYETVSVTPNTTYTFTAWVADIDLAVFNTSPETLSFLAGSTLLGSGFSPSTPGTWTEFTATFFSGSNTSETLKIIDTNAAPQGNDFALDDISTLTSTPEPASMLLFGTGLLGIACLLRRR